ncbi:MAG: S9 family peptidase [Blastocatellia bacterium]
MMNRNRILPLLLLTLLTLVPLRAQERDPRLLTLERIFSARDFATQPFGPARWIDGGAGYTTVEPSASTKDGSDIVRYDTASGQRRVLVAASQLIAPGATKPLDIDDYSWSADGKRLLIFTSSQRVWRQNTRGDYYVLDLSSGRLSKIGKDARPSTLMFAQFSPDGRRVAYVRENNIYVEGIDDHRLTALTRDGSATLINGTFDWVYEEEFSLRNGFRWSPDGRRIAYWQLDSTGVPLFHLINNTDALYPKLIPIPYPKTGQTNSAARIGVVSADGGRTQWMNVPGDPRNQYIAAMEWAGNSDELLIQQLNRLQNENQVRLCDARTGQTRLILTERDPAWVDVRMEDIYRLNGGRSFTWSSERDGWRHVYVVSQADQQARLITPGDFDVIQVEGVDEKNGWLYFAASPDNATQRYLYRARLDGSGRPERITPAVQSGTHTYDISPDGLWAFHTYSSFETPPRIDLIRLPQHTAIRALSENTELQARVRQLQRSPAEFFRVNIGDNVQLDGWMIKPPGFDATKRYPVLFHVYGEPAGQTVLDRWGGRNYLWHLMLAQQGYVIISVDNRGTPAPRGREWRKMVYRKIGVLASQDQAAAAREIIRWPFVDSSRIGIWGWSGGGSMSLNMIFRHPELYHTAMSVAPVPDMHLYDTIYQERYMGLPQQNEEDYQQGSPITFAEQLRGNLLIVHGTGDDNVHYQGTERLINKLIALNKPFTMMAYPNRSHSISEGRNTSRHLYELLTRYLRQNLPAGPQPAGAGK